MAKMEEPEREHAKEYTEPTHCEHCGNKTPMELVASFHKTHDEGYVDGNYYQEFLKWKLLFCPVCSSVNLLKANWIEWGNSSYYEGYEYEPEPENSEDYEVLYPTWGKPILGLPPDVGREYQSACKVRNVDSNAFGVLIGRVIDKVCLDRGAVGKTLSKRIESLAKMGEIPEKLSDMAHNLRKLRNIGAHADLGDLTDDEVPVLDDLCRAILEYVYAAPKLIEQVELRLEELKNGTEEEKEGGVGETEVDDDIPF